jgi:hypothetical protein
MGARRLGEFVFVLLATPACSENVTAKPPPPDPPSDGRKTAAHATEVSCASMPEGSGEGCTIEAGTGGELCGVPEGEPTCTPQRSTSIAGSSTYDGAPTDADADGDGIDDEDDTCPAVFDPIRPVDDGAQPDTDGDGTGDACDSTPA